MRDNSGSTFALSLPSNFSTGSTSATDVTGMSFPIGANEIWTFKFRLNVGKSAQTNGIKMGMNVPSGATFKAMVRGTTSAATLRTTSVITAAATLTTEVYHNRTGSLGVMRIWGSVRNGATPGFVTLQTASVTSQNALIVAGSSLAADREA